jgi:4-diphosphocytidyl-2-C-methyl-D-erythritol kinase
VEETAYAKINLALHVRERRADGYHALETLFAFAEEGDRLEAEDGNGISLRITGACAANLSVDDNLVTRAARAFIQTFALNGGIALHLEKNLPVASGIGGGSADAAAVLRLLARRHDVPLDDSRLTAIAAALGADVPACLASVAVHGEGRGDMLTAIPETGLAGMPLLLVNPRLPLATGDVFRGWDGIDRGPLAGGDPLAAARAGRNDLETPARRLLPVIGDLLDLLASQPGTALVRMSGSGATCFALFETLAARDAADRAIAAAEPGWWRLGTRLR